MPGEALPTIRELAAHLGTSPATVSAAYRLLRERGLVVGAGRRGTRVAQRPALRTARDAEPAPLDPGIRHNLSQGLPDPALLPPLAPALARLDIPHPLPASDAEPADPQLVALARAGFLADGVPGGALTVLGGALDAIERILEAQLAPGDRVVIEDPAYPPLRDILLMLRLLAVPVPVDDAGLQPDRLAAALAGGAQAIVLVPRAQNPFGAALDTRRATELRSVLGDHPGLLLVEDDHAGPVAGPRYATLAAPERERWAVVRSASKALHPDLRLALVVGDEETIARVEGRHALGSRWVSLLLQRLAVELLADPGTPDLIERARSTYAERRAALIGALAARGMPAHGRSGMNVWIPVKEEAEVVSACAQEGWLLTAGERFRLRTPPAVRVTTSTLPTERAEELAELLALAAAPRRAHHRY